MSFNASLTPPLNYRRQGTGSPVLLIHGLFGNLDNLNGVNRVLSTMHDVIAVDVRNHGLSPRTDTMSYQEMASDVLALMDQLELEKAAIVGHSMGGKIAMMAAKLAPERVSRLVAADIAPVAYRQARHDAVFRGLLAVQQEGAKDRQEADRILARHIEEAGVRQFLLKSFVTGAPESWRFNLQALVAHYQDIIGWSENGLSYAGPILFIKGGDSDYLLPEYQPEVLAQFPAAKVRIIPGTGHWLHAEKPQLFNRLVQDFLAQAS
ncbi:alpha/beta fold hydrolase [Zobellella maritima]|uniref:alpha/beta fold hydrolase n=1 Tax=Zobellella maritima TaxID=2059725 RepID=UPI000E304681|nr:alpha/beta fold hydrolase [Zobellella maritima]